MYDKNGNVIDWDDGPQRHAEVHDYQIRCDGCEICPHLSCYGRARVEEGYVFGHYLDKHSKENDPWLC